MKSIHYLFVLLLFTYTSNAQVPGAVLFDDAVLHEIHFNNVDTTIFINSKNYQSVDMVVDGVPLNNIGFKKKGNISAFHPNNKFPFKIKTNKYVSGQKYDDIKEFTLHNNYEDPTYMREKITYDICKDMGLHSLRTAYAKVYINGAYWGLYTLIEGKDQLYKLQFNNNDGDAIESLDFGDMCYIDQNQASYDYDLSGTPRYQLENGDPATAWSRFISMLDAANNIPDASYVSTVSQQLNLEDFFTYQALNVYLLNFDSYIGFRGNQIYYYDTLNTMWQVIPWDFNASLGLWNSNNHSPTSYPILPNVITTGCIASKLQTVPALKNYYMDAMCLMNQSLLDTMTINNRIDQLKAQIQTAVYTDWRKMHTNIEFDNTLEYGYYGNILPGENIPALKTFFADRAAVISQGIINEGYNCPALSTQNILPENTSNNWFVYPNPSSDGSFTIEFDVVDNYTIEIFNSLGQKIQEDTVDNTTSTNIQLDSGVYFLSVRSKNNSIVQSTTIIAQ